MMIRTAALCALALGVAACGDGNPFTTGGGGTPGGGTDDSTVPATILNDLDRIRFDAASNTLIVEGLTQDGVPLINEYTAVATTFAPGYTTFTGQNDPLGRHATAFVASRDGVQGGVVLTGGQFNRFFGGAFFERDGTYQAPTAPESRFDVTYYGNYAGGLNFPGPLTDLLPVQPGLDPDVDVPVQTAYVRGMMFVNVDLNDMSVEGEIYNRTGVFSANPDGSLAGTSLPDAGFLDLPDIVLVEGVLTNDGTFSGNLEVDGEVGADIGDFAGVIGGPGGEAMAGGTTLADFDDRLTNEIEYGVFVLDLCVAGNADPICVNALQP
jgi:hypothetical protein